MRANGRVGPLPPPANLTSEPLGPKYAGPLAPDALARAFFCSAQAVPRLGTCRVRRFKKSAGAPLPGSSKGRLGAATSAPCALSPSAIFSRKSLAARSPRPVRCRRLSFYFSGPKLQITCARLAIFRSGKWGASEASRLRYACDKVRKSARRRERQLPFRALRFRLPLYP